MPRKKDGKNGKKNNKSISREKRIELTIGWIGVFISIISLIISVRAIALTKKQMALEYNKSRPNLSMGIETTKNKDTNKDILRCQIKNYNGVVRAGEIDPYLFLKFVDIPDFFAELDESYFNGGYVIEITDVFAPYFGNGVYWAPNVNYSPDEESWFLEIDKERLLAAYELMGTITDSMNDLTDSSVIAGNCDFVINLSYVDALGNRQEELYTFDGFPDEVLTSSEAISIEPIQLLLMDDVKYWGEHLNFENSIGILLGENLELLSDEKQIAELVDLCYEGMFGT